MADYSPDPSRWALVPDEADKSTWRLPLYREGASLPDAKLVARALGALAPDASPTIPNRPAKAVRAKVRRAYRALHGSGVTLPAAIAKALDLTWVAKADDVFVPGRRGVMIAFAPDGVTADAIDAGVEVGGGVT